MKEKLELAATVISVEPAITRKNGEHVDYERIELATSIGGEISGYCVLNSFVPGTFKIGDKFDLVRQDL